MTNEELFNLTREHESRPWWPAGLHLLAEDWVDWRDVPHRSIYFEWGRDSDLDADAAERLLLGSAVMWLVKNEGELCMCMHSGSKYSSWLFDPFECFASPLAAVLAACEAAYKAGGGK